MIVYEDNHLLVVEKPVNIPTQADESGDQDLLSLLKEDIKKRYNKPGNVYLGLVHRLDRPAGGLMVFAKTSKASSRLSEQLRKKQIKKTYLACVYGHLPEKKGILKHHLLKDTKKNIVSAVSSQRQGAKEAILYYERLASRESLHLVKINLETGRPHQIRVQFSTIGCPLYGDQKYGQKTSRIGQQLALWSYRLVFIHPTKNEEMVFTSNPPIEFPWTLFADVII